MVNLEPAGRRKFSASLLARDFYELLNRFLVECPHGELFDLLSVMRRKQNYLNLEQLFSLPGTSEPTLDQIRQFEAELQRRLSMRTRLRLAHRMDVIVIGFLAEHAKSPEDERRSTP